ncbi:hypothetical protein V2K62_14070 [Pseudomonas alliivorans]|uniref:Uncharacterized protein n=1 Tax=Pseudomonas alliivorans TaxID=2810613 RepID=A0ABS4CCV7_9PSED|nr:hypothetical protein [Pseudomonas alliivorans]MBP0948432.1 hypothetical protein [Pseudomonas alliivorans]MBP0950740.1 hypothetical protein [Pseudomonas alliivorans]MEE4328811.1 hypothetical protein [Pseudomonas alliivorans]MEE4334095.1 hypothetical protein [Pseudomonas alliivorans]MEE4343091.1 hypothetical protein [Pseudomonas alliivorans]
MKTNRTRVIAKAEPGNAVFDKGLQSFDAQARLARRGFQVVMATKVFGVASLLDNNLPSR